LNRTTLPPADEPIIQILGYQAEDKIPRPYWQGPAHRIFSATPGQREDVALHALKEALIRRKKVAMATFCKRANSWPVLGAIFPNTHLVPELVDDDTKQPPPLIFLQLPFAGDVKDFPVFVEEEQSEVAAIEETSQNDGEKDRDFRAAKGMIQSLMLNNTPDEHVPVFPQNPYTAAWNQTLLARAMDPKAPPVTDQIAYDMQTPPSLLTQAQPALDAFRETFSIKTSAKPDPKKTTGSVRGRNKVLTYTDFL